MAQFTVTNLNDSGSGSLRNAIENANNTEGKDEIVFDSNLQGSIELTSDRLNITDSIVINGSGTDKITIDARGIESTIFNDDNRNIDSNLEIEISDLTLITGISSSIFGFLNIVSLQSSEYNLRITNVPVINSLGETLVKITDSPDTIIATDNDDIIIGTANDDLIKAKALPIYDISRSQSSGSIIDTYSYIDGGGDYTVLDGNDVFNGKSGNDTIEGGYGDDTINGGFGNDFLYGSYNPQFFDPYRISLRPVLISPDLFSSFGRDESGFYFQSDSRRFFDSIIIRTTLNNIQQFNLDGNDIINGGNGNDTIRDENGSNFLAGGKGNDTIESYSQDEGNNLVGGKGNDSITGVGILQGNLGNDTLIAIGNDSKLFGGNGNDLLVTGENNDLFPTVRIGLVVGKYFGGDGNDTLIGSDFLDGGNGNDSLVGEGLLKGGNGNDTVNGFNSNDTLKGNSGNDFLLGDDGDDLLVGGKGDDTLIGDRGKDILSGNLGSDTFVIQNISDDEDRDIIRDFEDGVDKIGLSDGLTYNTGSSTDISIIGSVNSFIKNNDGVLLAVIKNVNPRDLDVTDFTEVI